MPCETPDSDDEESDESDSSGQADSNAADDPFAFVNPFDEPAVAEEPPPPAAPPPLSTNRVECEKTARDAIDAIDLRMRQGYTKEEGQAYMAELLELTRALRACKTL